MSHESLASETWIQFFKLPPHNTSFKMNKREEKIQVFIDRIQLETQTVFFENGSIHTTPCAFEENPNLIPNADRVSQKGRMVTLDDGTSSFRPYASDSGHRYKTLFRTPHGEVKETKECVIFQLRFPKRYGKILIVSMLRDEHLSVLSFLKSYRKLFKPHRMNNLNK